MTGSYHLRGRYFWILVCLLLVLVIAPEPQQPLPRAEAATFTVNTLADSGAGSLRDAMNQANLSAGADTINFSVFGTITLSSALPAVTDDVTINGPGSPGITLDGNNATRIMFVTSGTVTLNDLTFQNGVRDTGGAIFNDSGTLTITNSTFSANSALDDFTGVGGAIWNSGGTLDIDNSTFSGNSANRLGGAIQNNGTATINNSTFSGNTAGGTGGAIRNEGTLTITSSTFGGNSASNGGAIWSGNVTATITSSTFSGNTATSAGGTLYRYSGTINVASSLIVGGDCDGTITDLGNNLSSNAAGCPNPGNDPQLGPLQNNGGPTDTMLPALGGPAVDAYPAPCATATDQRGFTRPQGLSCDIGATDQAGPVVALNASAVCNGPNLDVTISAGNAPFDITASAGINTPVNGVSAGTTTINGPEKWDDLTVTERMGDFESINLGQYKCRTDERPTPLTPAHRSRTTNPFPLFSWTPISIANNYRIFIFDNKVAADRTVDIRRNSFGATSMTLGVGLPDGRLFWRVRGRQNRVWSLWSVRFTLFKDPAAPITIIENAPVPTIDLNPPSDDNSAPNPAPTLPPPPNSR